MSVFAVVRLIVTDGYTFFASAFVDSMCFEAPGEIG